MTVGPTPDVELVTELGPGVPMRQAHAPGPNVHRSCDPGCALAMSELRPSPFCQLRRPLKSEGNPDSARVVYLNRLVNTTEVSDANLN